MKIQPPKMPTQLADASVVLAIDGVYEGLSVSDLAGIDAVATNSSFDECVLKKPQCQGLQAEKMQLRDVRILGGDFSAARMSDGAFIRIVCDGVRMIGLDISRGKLKDAVFKNCKLSMTNLRFTHLKNVTFEDCVLTECDFQNATLETVSFIRCHMEKVNIHGAHNAKVDMRTSHIENMLGWRSAKGVTIDTVQLMYLAPEIAAALDITIAD